jgi:hypothetical protein
MAAQRLLLPPGDHELEEPVSQARLHSFDAEHRLAKLLLTATSPRTSEQSHPAATTLAVYLDEGAVRELLDALSFLTMTMGSPPPRNSGSKA